MSTEAVEVPKAPAPSKTEFVRFKLPKNLWWNGNIIWWKIHHRGQGYGGSCETNKKAEAIAVLKKQQVLIFADQKAVTKVVRIDELLDDYLADLKRKGDARTTYRPKTLVNVESAVRCHLRPAFGHMKAHQLESRHLDAHVDARMQMTKPDGTNYSRVSINRELSYLRVAFNLGAKKTPRKVGIVPIFPIDVQAEARAERIGIISGVEGVEVDDDEGALATEDQYQQLLAVLPHYLKIFMMAAVLTGIRQREGRYVRWTQINWTKGIMSLPANETKSGKARDIGLAKRLLDALRVWKQKTDEEFPGAEKVFHYKGKQVTDFKNAWNSALLKVGLRVPRFHPDGTPILGSKGKPLFKNLIRFHDTRRTYVTLLSDSMVSEEDSMSGAGHDTVKIHRNYNRSTQTAKRAKLKMDEHLDGKKTPEKQPEPKAAKAEAVDIIHSLDRLDTLLEKGTISNTKYEELREKLLS